MRSYGEPHGDLHRPPLLGSCNEAQTSILETCLRSTCACPCALLILNYWFDLLTWPHTCFITADMSGNLEYCLTLHPRVAPTQVLWDCALLGGIIALPALLLPSAPGFLLLWGSPFLLLPQSSYPRAMVLHEVVSGPLVVTWCVKSVRIMQKCKAQWQWIHSWSLLLAILFLSVQDRTVPSNRRAGRECLVLFAGFWFPHVSPAFKLKLVSVKLRSILMSTTGQSCSWGAGCMLRNCGLYVSRRVRGSTFTVEAKDLVE